VGIAAELTTSIGCYGLIPNNNLMLSGVNNHTIAGTDLSLDLSWLFCRIMSRKLTVKIF